MEVIVTLFTIASSLLLDKAVLYLNTLKNQKNGVSADQVLTAINKMTNEARAKGTNILNNLNDKIAAMTLPYGVSPAVKDVVQDKRREAAAALRKARTDITNVESKLNTIDNRASAYASLPEETRGTLSSVKDNIIKDAGDVSNEMTNIEKGVEKYV